MANETTERVLESRIQLRNDTAANWAAANPVLLKGEIGIELGYVVLEERVLHRNECVASLDDIAGVGHDIVGVVNVQFEGVELVRLETSLVLCRSTQRQKAQCENR